MKLQKKWWALAVISLGVMMPFAVPYLSLDPDQSRISIESETVQYPLLIVHICTAMVALITGLVQFIDPIRLKKPRFHRYTGRVYVLSVMISGLTAIGLFFYEKDYSRALSFLVLALLWLFTSWKGYRTAVNRKFEEHRKWMVRSFAITLVAVCARLLTPLLFLTYIANNGFSFAGFSREAMIETVLNVNIWPAIIVNLIIVEWWGVGTKEERKRK